MATLEDLGRMAMVEVDSDTTLPADSPAPDGWGKMTLLLAASAAVCGLVVGLRKNGDSSGNSGEPR